ncbi:5-deoxy-glucuronate isomerase [Streptomyces sp. NPDC020490]|uniref:5-deoxy-glucuronate isomerase n=1 Tax=Streptomyces sp. NPDC020490 TaxID=3365078 RepID=UPI0037B567B9
MSDTSDMSDELRVLPRHVGCTVQTGSEEPQLPDGASVFVSDTGAAHAPRDPRVQIASGAGDRFALAGAKCERRLPARYGPAPEVPNGFGRTRVSPRRESAPEGFHPDHREGHR